MTRSNFYVTLSNGEKVFFVIDASSAPEQGYIVERFIVPLLNENDPEKELALIKEHCHDSFMEKRINARYRYHMNLKEKIVNLYEEWYDFQSNKFIKGKDLTVSRYIPYIMEHKFADFHHPAFKEYPLPQQG